MREIKSEDARRSFSSLMDEVLGGARIAISRFGRPIAVLVPFDWHEKARVAMGEPRVVVADPEQQDLERYGDRVKSVVYLYGRGLEEVEVCGVTPGARGTCSLGWRPQQTATDTWRVRSERTLHSVADVIVRYSRADDGLGALRFQWDGTDIAHDLEQPGADRSCHSGLVQIRQARGI